MKRYRFEEQGVRDVSGTYPAPLFLWHLCFSNPCCPFLGMQRVWWDASTPDMGYIRVAARCVPGHPTVGY